MKKRSILFVTILFALSLALNACAPTTASEEPDGPVQVTVSILPQAFFVERIAGDLVAVNVMVGPGDDAHTYEPRPDQMIALSESVIFFSIGIEYEDAWLPRFEDTNPDMEIIDSSEGITRIMETIPHTHDHEDEHGHHHDDHDHHDEDDHGHHDDHDHHDEDDHGHHDDHDHHDEDDHGHHDDHDHHDDDDHGHHDDHDHHDEDDHGHHDDHDHHDEDDHGHHDDHDHHDEDDHGHHHHDELGLDPHVWLTPANGKIIATNIYNALVAVSPENEAVFTANFEELVAEIEALDARITDTLSGLTRRNFMVYHPAWGYFAEAYGLTQLPIKVGGMDPSARGLAALIDQALEEEISVVFVQPQFSEANARAIAQEIGGGVVKVDPLAFDWLTNLETVAEAFATALGN